ncbi:MAG: hypothetical protein MUP55_02560, partial [Candidatus Aenigmarchaeota archaeon]|nr:hypothetical protein [Candidatus Aenigmarchaeota archaeon]
ICANDTQGLSGCTGITNLTAAGITPLNIIPNITSINISNITVYSGNSFAVNFTVYPQDARAYNTSANLSVPQNWTASPNYFDFGNILKYSSKYNTTSIIVSNGTLPGIYLANITANWTNLDNTSGYNSTSIQVNVLPNPMIDILEESQSLVITGGNIKNATFTLMSIGNTNATNISFFCISGIVCQNFTINFTPSNISSMAPLQSTAFNVTVNVPLNYPAGTYDGIIKANATGGIYDLAFISVFVPINLSWTQTPPQMTMNVIQGTQGKIGDITIQNTGNAFMTLGVTNLGNGSSRITINTTQISLPMGGYGTIGVNYTAPVLYNLTTYSTEIMTINTTADPSVRSTSVSINVYPLFVNIIYPTESNPRINVSENDTIEILVNVTYGTSPLTSNLTWNISMVNTSMAYHANLNSANYSLADNLWHLNFSAPNMPLGAGFDLNVTITYNMNGTNLTHFDYEGKAIIYTDPYPPDVVITVPPRVPANSSTYINVTAIDPGGVKNTTLMIRYPDNSSQNFNMIYVSRTGDNYLYTLLFTNTTQIGIYSLNATACDLSSNCNSTSTTFEIFPAIWFSGLAVDEEKTNKPPINVSFYFYMVGTNTTFYNFSSNPSTGLYNKTIDARNYDLFVTVWNDSLMFYNTPILVNVYNPVIFGKIRAPLIGRGAVRGIAADAIL